MKYRIWDKTKKCWAIDDLCIRSDNSIFDVSYPQINVYLKPLSQDDFIINPAISALSEKQEQLYQGDIIQFKYHVGDFAWERMNDNQVKENHKINDKLFIGIITPDILVQSNMEVVCGQIDSHAPKIMFSIAVAINCKLLGNIYEHPKLIKKSTLFPI